MKWKKVAHTLVCTFMEIRELGREVQKSWRKDWVKTHGHWVSSDGEMELYKFDMSEEGTREEMMMMMMEEYAEKEMMGRIPEELWAKGDYDIGKLKCNPIEIKIKQGSQRPFRQQYKVKQEAEEEIEPVIRGLKEAGILVTVK